MGYHPVCLLLEPMTRKTTPSFVLPQWYKLWIRKWHQNSPRVRVSGDAAIYSTTYCRTYRFCSFAFANLFLLMFEIHDFLSACLPLWLLSYNKLLSYRYFMSKILCLQLWQINCLCRITDAVMNLPLLVSAAACLRMHVLLFFCACRYHAWKCLLAVCIHFAKYMYSILQILYLCICLPDYLPVFHLLTCTVHLPICLSVSRFLFSPVHLRTCPSSSCHLPTCSDGSWPSASPSICLQVSFATCYLANCSSAHLSNYLPVYLPTCPAAYLSICLPVQLPTCLSAYLSSCLPVYLSTCPSTYPTLCLPAYLRFFLSISLIVQA